MNFDSFRIFEKSIKPYFQACSLNMFEPKLDKNRVLILTEKYEVYGDTIELYQINRVDKSYRAEYAFSKRDFYVLFKNGKQVKNREIYCMKNAICLISIELEKSIENYNRKYFA